MPCDNEYKWLNWYHAVVARWARHDPGCPFHEDQECRCGLAEMLSTAMRHEGWAYRKDDAVPGR